MTLPFTVNERVAAGDDVELLPLARENLMLQGAAGVPVIVPSRAVVRSGSSSTIMPRDMTMPRPALVQHPRTGCSNPCRTDSRSPATDCP
jgi:hypothetical protein